jgi:hypothetical protein
MAVYTNKGQGLLILPTNERIAPGQDVELSEKQAEIPGVAAWIKSGVLAKKAGRPKNEVNADAFGKS